ncbi:MAG: hypothetical protein R3E53_07630 [Myxococcota bacterium]
MKGASTSWRSDSRRGARPRLRARSLWAGRAGERNAPADRDKEGARGASKRSVPELVERSAEADLFVCCHVQDDPSCTYLEASGAGLPIAGYGNRMWRHFAAAAGSGVVTPMKRPVALAEAIGDLLAAPDRLATLSRRARAFALEHCFEREFEKRVDAIRPYLGPGPGTDPA